MDGTVIAQPGLAIDQAIDPNSYTKAILNILEDSHAERGRLEATEKAILNILDDFIAEKGQLEATQKAVLNILDDFEEEKQALRHAKSAADAANRELEAFSYSVAHDLRAPLRSIDGFSQALLEDYHDKLDAEGKTHLGYVRESAQQMAQLIDDLLALSRVSRGEIQRERTDLATIAHLVMTRLQKREPERKIVLVVPTELVAVGDPRLLGIVLENLLGNAWKFTSKQPAARIELGHRIEAGRSVYFVRDDGSGFDMAYADKLFGAFQRLHSVNEFEGTGIGLATVQRIVRRHGGSVWAKGEVGRGATFYFALEEGK
jgi:light-regulated signal transduction histidine kinase (bacteriophytochrome)